MVNIIAYTLQTLKRCYNVIHNNYKLYIAHVVLCMHQLCDLQCTLCIYVVHAILHCSSICSTILLMHSPARSCTPVYTSNANGVLGCPTDLHGNLALLPLLRRENTEEEEEHLPCYLPCCHYHSVSDWSCGSFGLVPLHYFSVSASGVWL